MNKYPVQAWIGESRTGISVPKIAKKYGVSKGIIFYWFKKAGFKVPNIANRPELSEVDKAWVAAVIDCESTLTIHRPYNKKRNFHSLMYYCRVEMITYKVPEKLHRLCGGSYVKDKWPPRDNCRATSYWNLTPAGLRWLLPQIIPYLLVKRRRAEIILEILTKRHRGAGQRYMSDADLLKLYREVRQLNKKGFRGRDHWDKTKATQVLCQRKP